VPAARPARAQEARAREALAEAADAGADPGEAAEPASEPENEMEAERAANISRNNRALADFGLAPDALPPDLPRSRGARPRGAAGPRPMLPASPCAASAV
jgi:hypothetical protein